MDTETREKIKEHIVEHLKRVGGGQISLDENIKNKYGLNNIYCEELFHISLEIMNDFYRGGVILFNPTQATDFKSLPPCKVTEYGKELLESDGAPVYDPDGYLSNIQDNIPNLDPVIFNYLKESITAFNRECPMSAAITLGVASEKMILLLYESLLSALENKHDKEKLQKVENQLIFKKHKEIESILNEKKKKLPKEILVNYDIYLNGLFHLMRLHRNGLGHPTGITVEKSVIRVFLKCFGVYLIHLYSLKNYLDEKQNQI